MDVSGQLPALAFALINFAANDEAPTNPDGSPKALEGPTFNETWADMEQVLASGKVRAIDISNFSIKKLVLHPPARLHR